MDYFEPKNVPEALSTLAREGENAKVIAGGTDVLVDMKFKEDPGCLVNIKRIPGLNFIRENGNSLLIGPMTTIREIETNNLVRERFSALWDAAHQFASLQIRNTATIGGNICRASPSGEVLAPLLVLGAKVRMAFEDGEKSALLDSFFLAPGKTLLGSRGILTAIEIPYPAERTRSLYLKHAGRGAMDIAIVGVAILATRGSDDKHFSDVRIGLGAVAPTPIRVQRAEAIAQEKPFNQKQVQDAAKEAAAESNPITDHRGSAEYRRWIVEALTQKGLTALWEAGMENGGH